MKIKSSTFIFTLFVILSITILSIICINHRDDDKHIDKVINLVIENKEYDLKKSKIAFYKETIQYEINESNENYIKRKGYCALGYISFLEGDYEYSKDCFLKAINYRYKTKDNITLLSYNGLSKAYLALDDLSMSKYFFNEVVKIGEKLGKYQELSNIYRSRAIDLTNTENGVGEGIALLERALQLKQSDKSKVEIYRTLSQLYIYIDAFETATNYAVKAISLADSIEEYQLRNDSILTLAGNFLSQKQYQKAINVYKDFLKREHDLSKRSVLSANANMIYCYYRLNELDKTDMYIENYKKITDTLPLKKMEKEMIWLYTIQAQIELKRDNIKGANIYINKANDLYKRNKANCYPNTRLWIEQVQIDILSKTEDYEVIIKKYENLFNKIEAMGAKYSIYDEVLETIINISKINGDTDTLLKYTQKKLDDLQGKIQTNLETSATYAMSKFENSFMKDEFENAKKRNILFFIFALIVIVVLIAIYRKNIKIKVLNKELKSISLTDSLTTLKNKRYFYNILEDIIKNRQTITIIMIDVDYFKLYNDNYGHLEGDNVLRSLGVVLKEVFVDDIACRYGGEEFAVISKENTTNINDKLNLLIKNIYELNIEHKYSECSDRITVSMGIETMKICNQEDVENIIKKADYKLYQSKKHGRNRYTL